MRTKEVLLDIPELFVEVHHKRGDFSKFEVLHPDTGIWIEGPTVWDLRKGDDEWWIRGSKIYDTMNGYRMLRVTRYPDLEATIGDVTYHPSVPAWKIDIDKVREFLNG